MPALEYQHIGHTPGRGEVALFSVDEAGRLHEDRRRPEHADASWLDWSHDRVWPEVSRVAAGRVELSRGAGSIHINDPAVEASPARLARLVSLLEIKYPHTRWYLFGSSYRGEHAAAVFARAA